MTVYELLARVASVANSDGSTWYSQNKSNQVIAKDIFDSINNRVVIIAL